MYERFHLGEGSGGGGGGMGEYVLIFEAFCGRDPCNQNFRAEVRTFWGGERITTCADGLVPFSVFSVG